MFKSKPRQSASTAITLRLSPLFGQCVAGLKKEASRSAPPKLKVTKSTGSAEIGAAPSSKLVRGLGLLDASMIVVGSMIGSGIFITSAESARLTGAPGWLLLAWTIAGVMTITG